MSSSRRALHFVFKVGNRNQTIKFYKDILGMKVLRHEEFEEGCKATCNGPYDGKWSKTMIGYGPENNHFVVELTYNYGVGSYKLGNDFLGITIKSSNVIKNIEKYNMEMTKENDTGIVEAPGGYKFFIKNGLEHNNADPVEKVTLACSNLKASLEFWNKLLEMNVYEQGESTALLGYSENQCKLELRDIKGPINHATAFGRIAFACPESELPGIEEKVKKGKYRILTPLVSLDTPGKATVQVVIIADPDGHEICFVGDEAFCQLSKVDPKADILLKEAMSSDRSDEWFAENNITKSEG